MLQVLNDSKKNPGIEVPGLDMIAKKHTTMKNTMKRLIAVINDDDFKFELKELVCQHVYDRYIVKLGWSEMRVWDMFDIRTLETLLFIRKALNKPITINTWGYGGVFCQRGLRCALCNLVATKLEAYISPHVIGLGLDFDVEGMTAQQVRDWLEDNARRLPHPIRLEKDKPWVHADVHTYRPEGDENTKVYLFAA